jgi:hypothetical protein
MPSDPATGWKPLDLSHRVAPNWPETAKGVYVDRGALKTTGRDMVRDSAELFPRPGGDWNSSLVYRPYNEDDVSPSSAMNGAMSPYFVEELENLLASRGSALHHLGAQIQHEYAGIAVLVSLAARNYDVAETSGGGVKLDDEIERARGTITAQLRNAHRHFPYSHPLDIKYHEPGMIPGEDPAQSEIGFYNAPWIKRFFDASDPRKLFPTAQRCDDVARRLQAAEPEIRGYAGRLAQVWQGMTAELCVKAMGHLHANVQTAAALAVRLGELYRALGSTWSAYKDQFDQSVGPLRDKDTTDSRYVEDEMAREHLKSFRMHTLPIGNAVPPLPEHVDTNFGRQAVQGGPTPLGMVGSGNLYSNESAISELKRQLQALRS